VPGDRHGPGPGPKGPAALPEPVLKRIRAALDSVAGEASADPVAAEAPAQEPVAGAQQAAASAQPAALPQRATKKSDKPEPPAQPASLPRRAPRRGDKPGKGDKPEPPKQPAPLPRRVPGAGDGREPPAVIAKPTLPPSLPRFPLDDASTDQFPAITASMLGGIKEETAKQPDAAARPESATAMPADPDVVVIPPQPPGEQRPDRPDRQDEEPGRPEPAGQEDGQARPGEAPARTAKPSRRAKAPARPPKPAPRPAAATAPGRSRPLRRTRRRRVIVDGLILMVALLSAGSVAFLLTRHASTTATANGSRSGAPAGTGLSTEAAVRDSAAAWVASQVSRGVKVSCDQAMCQALKAHGLPAASLLALSRRDPDPPRSGVLIVTTVVSRMMGSRSVAADAPVTIASFGAGSLQISVRVIAPRGAAAYSSALRSDIAARVAGGTGLLQNQRITVAAAARRQLLDGEVDSRVLLTIANLASQQPVSVVAFGDLASGASPGVPFRCADLAVPGGSTGSSPAAQVRSISAFLRGLGSFYPSAHIQVVQLGGRKVLQVEFPAPSPLGLLGPLTP
jgi:hypothetical protein